MKYTLIICSLLIWLHSYSQKQANIWYFGNGAGLDFNGTCTPSVLTDGQIDGFEGCVTMCDKTTGQLLFYTNSEKIWNKNHQVVPNSTLVLVNGNSITQVVIIQKPGSTSKYYVFTSQVQSMGQAGLKLHELDLSLNAGLGGLTFKDSLICKDTMTEGLTAIRHGNGVDIWVVAHQNNSNKYFSYLVNSSGVNLPPVVSAIGKRRSYAAIGYADEIGEIKASPNGNKLASVTLQNPHIELFDFNKNTGQVTNLITLPELGGATSPTNGSSSGLYGVSFSPNNKFLYVSKIKNSTNAWLNQYNITSNDSAITSNSKVTLFTSTTTSVYSLKLAPNKKIYVGHNNNPYIGVINFPDSAGTNCNYVDNGVFLNGKTSGWGLNNHMELNAYCPFTVSTVGFEEDAGEDLLAGIFPNPVSDVSTLKFRNTSNAPYRVFIYDAFGKEILWMETCSNEFAISCKELGRGLFFYRLVTQNQLSCRGRFFVE